jgi:hypothetical protein
VSHADADDSKRRPSPTTKKRRAGESRRLNRASGKYQPTSGDTTLFAALVAAINKPRRAVKQ